MQQPQSCSPLEIHRHRIDGVEVIRARGEIDISTAPLLSAALRESVDRDSGDYVVVDLCDVSFIDSSGLSVLLNALRRLTRQGRSLSIECRENGPAHQLLTLANLAGTFSVQTRAEGACT